MSTREVPVTDFGKNLLSAPEAFANDFIDALDARIKLNPVLENLTDMLKGTLKEEGAKLLREKMVDPLSAVTITCED